MTTSVTGLATTIRKWWQRNKAYYVGLVAAWLLAVLLLSAGFWLSDYKPEWIGLAFLFAGIFVLVFSVGFAPIFRLRYMAWRYSRRIRRLWGPYDTYQRARREFVTLPEGRVEECLQCKTPSHTLIMSMFSTTIICPACKADETKAPGYAPAEKAESDAIRNGDSKFNGTAESIADTVFLLERREQRKKAKQAS